MHAETAQGMLIVSERVARFPAIASSAVSQHFRILREADILIAERKGYFVHYRVKPDKLAELSGIVKRFFKQPVQITARHSISGGLREKTDENDYQTGFIVCSGNLCGLLAPLFAGDGYCL